MDGGAGTKRHRRPKPAGIGPGWGRLEGWRCSVHTRRRGFHVVYDRNEYKNRPWWAATVGAVRPLRISVGGCDCRAGRVIANSSPGTFPSAPAAACGLAASLPCRPGAWRTENEFRGFVLGSLASLGKDRSQTCPGEVRPCRRDHGSRLSQHKGPLTNVPPSSRVSGPEAASRAKRPLP